MSLFAAISAAVFTFLVSVTILLFVTGPTLLLQPRRRRADYYMKLGHPVIPTEAGLIYEEFDIMTYDNIKLDCWLIKSESPARGTLIYLHGVADCKISGIRFAKLFNSHHYDVFLFDSRQSGMK